MDGKLNVHMGRKQKQINLDVSQFNLKLIYLNNHMFSHKKIQIIEIKYSDAFICYYFFLYDISI